jgi:hypothetical protein
MRWTSPDPIIPDLTDPQSWDRYSYVRNNPLKYIDPDGHCPICALILLAFLAAGCASQPITQPPSLIDSTVNITDRSGNHSSLGTQISDNTALTHNHFGSPLNTYTAVDSTGFSQPFSGAASDPIGQDVVIDPTRVNTGQQTRLITLLDQMAGSSAQIASQQTINGLQLGDMVDIAYWDDANGQVTTGQFSISDVNNLGNGAISVGDPLGILNPGDSGGGVYYHGQLIGNLWSIVGGGHIALVPPGTNEKSKAKILVR